MCVALISLVQNASYISRFDKGDGLQLVLLLINTLVVGVETFVRFVQLWSGGTSFTLFFVKSAMVGCAHDWLIASAQH